MDNALEIGAWLVVVVVVVGSAAVSSSSRREDRRRQARLAAIERRLDAVIRHLGVEPPPPHVSEVESLLARGKVVHATKVYRDATGADLAEAADAVRRLGGRA